MDTNYMDRNFPLTILPMEKAIDWHPRAVMLLQFTQRTP